MAGIWRPGDLAVVRAVEHTASAQPALPAGWTAWGAGSTGGAGSATAYRHGARVLQDGDVDIGNWAGAGSVHLAIYRGARQTGAGLGALAGSGGNSSNAIYPALVLQVTDGSSWIIGVAIHENAAADVDTPPAGWVNRPDATRLNVDDPVGWNDTGAGVVGFGGQNVPMGVVGNFQQTTVYELRADLAGPGIEFLHADRANAATLLLPPQITAAPDGGRVVHRFGVSRRGPVRLARVDRG